MTVNLEVFAGLQEESNAGWVWVSPLDDIRSRDHIKISQAGNSVICVARIIDDNFRTRYNQSPRRSIPDQSGAIVISEYYRDTLRGIQTARSYDFEIQRIGKLNFISKSRALFQHPDNAIKIAGWLAFISILLSALGVVVSLVGMFKGQCR